MDSYLRFVEIPKHSMPNDIGIAHQRVTRQNNDLTLSWYRLATGQKTFTYRGTKVYNSIAKDIRDTGNLNAFKKRIFKYLFNS